jgi:HEAT repeat protein
LLAALATAEPANRVRLIAVLGERRAVGATDPLLRLARDPDLETAKTALRALGALTNPADLPRLIALALAMADDDVKTLADRAIVTTAMKIAEPARRADAVLAAFRAAPEPDAKAALLRPLAAVVRSMGGGHEAFFVVRAALQDSDEGLRAAAVRGLSDWPDAAPTTALLDMANEKDAVPARREAALRGALRLISPVATGRERSPLNLTRCFSEAMRAARTKEEKLLVVEGLGEWKRPDAIVSLESYLRDPDVRAEAAAALAQLNAAAKTKGKAKGKAPAPKGQAASGALFNGTDLAGWDGDPGVWRVRDGVIVGGSLEGNPRNEFLATTRRYRNFTLRLDYKVVGTEGFVNGGVQFRSVRIAQPPNEMSGYQADIGAGHSGCLYDESRRKKFLARAADEQIQRLEKPGDWNRYEIRCDGPRTELRLNGEPTVVYTESDPGVALEGLVALQIHGNCKAEIAYRNLEMEERP